MIPEDQEKLIEQIASSTGGGVGREAARAKLDALHVQTLGAALQQVSAELLETRQQMTATSKAASRHRRALVIWTAVLSFATLAYTAAAFLPLFRPSASDGRAWLQWMDTSAVSGPPSWTPYGAFTSHRDCVAAAQRAFDKFKVPGMKILTEDAAGGVFVAVQEPTMMMATSIKCLPDTVDPRGPKGK